MKTRRHELAWRRPAPLWSEGAPTGVDRAPALLRFTDERFMDDLAAELEAAPREVGEREVPALETWRDALAGKVFTAEERRAEPAKLYQPIHGRYYLVAASLVCEVPGLPDHRVNLAAKEKASILLRRLRPVGTGAAASHVEEAWRIGAGGGAWVQVADPDAPADDDAGKEERLPAFPVRLTEAGRPRTLQVALVPVSSRETFEAAPASGDTGLLADALAKLPLAEMDGRVSAGFAALEARYGSLTAAASDATEREALFFAALDLAEVIEAHLPNLWSHVAGTGAPVLTGAAATLRLALAHQDFGAQTWSAALAAAWALRDEVLAGTRSAGDFTSGLTRSQVVTFVGRYRTRVEAPLRDALTALPATPADKLAPRAPKTAPGLGSLYVIRFVYERPQCAELHGPLVSAPSRRFSLASYFDADAPVRPIAISLPVDTSIAGLRRFPKAVSFLLSNQLRRQMERVRGLKLSALDEGEIPPAPTLDLGMVCSFSIPIITIIALILLMIIASLLNIVFWWLPFLKICLPIRLDARSS